MYAMPATSAYVWPVEREASRCSHAGTSSGCCTACTSSMSCQGVVSQQRLSFIAPMTRSSSSPDSSCSHQRSIPISSSEDSRETIRTWAVAACGSRTVSTRAAASHCGGPSPPASSSRSGRAFHQVPSSASNGSSYASPSGTPGNPQKITPVASGSGR